MPVIFMRVLHGCARGTQTCRASGCVQDLGSTCRWWLGEGGGPLAFLEADEADIRGDEEGTLYEFAVPAEKLNGLRR